MATRKKVPDSNQEVRPIPDAKQQTKTVPDANQQVKRNPKVEQMIRQLPKVGNPQNTVMIGGKLIEIKPTKLKYQRNGTAVFYRILQLYPLMDVLAMDAGQFGDERDGDKAVMDWLIAVTDDEKLVTENYDDMDTGTIEKMLEIYKRVNKIDEKDAKLKNLEKTRKGAE